MFDLQDDENFDYSVLDRAKIEDLEMGEKMESESGSFAVIRQKNGYHVWCVRGKRRGILLCPTLEKAFAFLESN
jgi:hypothetical protein